MGGRNEVGKGLHPQIGRKDVMAALYVINKSNAEAYRKIISSEYFKEPVFTYEEFFEKV
jgi:hypothetical protein